MWVSRGCVMAVAIIAVLIATSQNSTILGLLSYAWGGFGSAFGPLVLCSLFWRRTNKQGAYAGIIVGGVVDLVWAQLSGGIFDLYEIVPGFVFDACHRCCQPATFAFNQGVTDEFDSYHHCVGNLQKQNLRQHRKIYSQIALVQLCDIALKSK